MNLFFIKIVRTDFISFITAILYVFIFRYIYSDYLTSLWGYYGYCDNNNNTFEVLFSNVIAVFPILYYSNKKKLSNFISIFLYVLIYLPTILMLQYYFTNFLLVIKYQIILLVSMVLFFLSDISYNKSVLLRTNYVPFKFYLWVGIFLSIFVLVYYGPGSLRFVSFNQVYELRSDNYDSKVTNFPLIRYFILWISNFFLPLFLAIGLVYRKNKFILIGLSMAVLIYMASGSKGVLLSPMFIFGIYWCLKKVGFKYLFPLIVFFFLLVMLLFELTKNSDSSFSTFYFMIAAILLMRTLGISALLNTAYIDFFEETKAYTYYGHINVVNYLIGTYPFGEDELGKAVWSGYTGKGLSEVMNANANFLATDGIAAMGAWGILFISILFFFLLKYLNKISERHNTDFVFILSLGCILSLLNVSLFTTLLSCGLIIVAIFLRYSTIKF